MGDHWRLWRVGRDGRLYAPFASLAAGDHWRQPWPGHGPVAAFCDQGHEPPAEGCECGLRGMNAPQDVLACAAMVRWLDLRTWDVPAAAAGLLTLAFGRVRLGGRVIGPSPNDPPGMARGQSARLAGHTLYVTGSAELPELTARYGRLVSPLAVLVASLREDPDRTDL